MKPKLEWHHLVCVKMAKQLKSSLWLWAAKLTWKWDLPAPPLQSKIMLTFQKVSKQKPKIPQRKLRDESWASNVFMWPRKSTENPTQFRFFRAYLQTLQLKGPGGLGFFSTFGIIPYVNVILSPVLLAKNNVVDCTEWKKKAKFSFVHCKGTWFVWKLFQFCVDGLTISNNR